jgi:hypothetical protein
LSRGLGYFTSEAEPNHIFPNQIVDNVTVRIANRRDDGLAVRLAATVAAGGWKPKTHSAVLKGNSGWALDPIVWARRTVASKILMGQNDRIAQALQNAGEDVIRPGGLTLISAVTNVVETQRVFRAVRFLPVVAARDRRPTVNGLKLFIHEHPASRYFRYAVMTCDSPVPAFGDLRGAIQTLSRRISKWAHEVRKPDKNGRCYDIEVLYRGIEFTRSTAAERDAAAAERGQESNLSARYGADTVLYHVHANVVYWPKRNIEKLWPEFLRFTERFMDAHWRDNGKIEKVEEIVKYCSKPADTLAAADDELVWLYRQTQRLKICQPMGEFKTWMKGLDQRREKVVRVHLGRGEGKLMRVKKGKRAGALDEEEADGDGNLIEVDDSEVDVIEDAGTEVPETNPKKRTRLGDGDPAANVVIGLSLPQWRHTPWSEPVIMVQNYDPMKLSDEAGGDIREWQRQAREWWDDAFAPEPEAALRVARMALDAAMSSDDIREAAEAACYIVHTCRPTVPTGTPDQLDECEIGNEDELEDDMKSVVQLFEGATIVKEIPYDLTAEQRREYEAWRHAAWMQTQRDRMFQRLPDMAAHYERMRQRTAALAASDGDCRAAA